MRRLPGMMLRVSRRMVGMRVEMVCCRWLEGAWGWARRVAAVRMRKDMSMKGFRGGCGLWGGVDLIRGPWHVKNVAFGGVKVRS